ncbi:trimeric intracellular cation channel family protein [Brevibacterium luteolum]|uniref:trimeric intracellular cation channel family protein n=1 Tax=Brevibacterium luteolum TaxID=199591 RepID=UPI003EE91D21
MNVSVALFVLELVGVFAFAISGNLLAARKDFDITGAVVLGYLAGIGGGIIRDVVLGEVPTSLREPIYLLIPLLAALVVYFIGRHTERARLPIVIFDAAGLALFCTTGTIIALEHGMNVYGSIMLGIITAVGGGLMRDVVANETPAVFCGSELYVIPAFTGALLAALGQQTAIWNVWVTIAAAAFVFAFRLIAWFRGWRAPGSMRGWSYRGVGTGMKRTASAFRAPVRRVRNSAREAAREVIDEVTAEDSAASGPDTAPEAGETSDDDRPPSAGR